MVHRVAQSQTWLKWLSSSSSYVMLSRSVISDSLWPHGLWPTRLLCPWASLGKNTRVGCCALLQGIFPTQKSNLGLPHCRRILYHLNYWGSPCEYLYGIPVQGKQIYRVIKQTYRCPEKRRKREGEEELIAKSHEELYGEWKCSIP